MASNEFLSFPIFLAPWLVAVAGLSVAAVGSITTNDLSQFRR
jgi:hypothetical protein